GGPGREPIGDPTDAGVGEPRERARHHAGGEQQQHGDEREPDPLAVVVEGERAREEEGAGLDRAKREPGRATDGEAAAGVAERGAWGHYLRRRRTAIARASARRSAA